MNKEVIKKYKKEFDWWLTGGEVFIQDQNGKWFIKQNDHWTYDGAYVINDKYVELRKALVEGKTVQYKAFDMANDYVWIDWGIGDNFNYNYEYRVKPEAPKFVIGDWVEYINTGYIGQVDAIVDSPTSYHLNGEYPTIYVPESSLEPWMPQSKEWCWFWYKGVDKPTKVLAQFECTEYTNKYAVTLQTGHSAWFDFCEPFIGQLLTSIKEK